MVNTLFFSQGGDEGVTRGFPIPPPSLENVYVLLTVLVVKSNMILQKKGPVRLR